MESDRPRIDSASASRGPGSVASDTESGERRPESRSSEAASPSPWWSAPSGGPVDIPSFARQLYAESCEIDALAAWMLLTPAAPRTGAGAIT